MLSLRYRLSLIKILEKILENSLSLCVLRFGFRVVFSDDACGERD
jgi:hypothetical protein